MKKLTLISIVLMMFFQIQGQNILNGSFENWSDVKTYSVDEYFSIGNVYQSQDAYQGMYSIRLENIYDEESQEATIGLVANTSSFDENSLDGSPYDEQPLSMRFWSKYDLALGDAAQVMAIFKLNGNVIGTAEILLEGNTSDTFKYFSVPIIWGVSTLPDSVVILMTSHEFETQEYNGNGSILIDDLHFATISTRNKSIPNEGFETWKESVTKALDGWTTVDQVLASSGILFPEKLVSNEPLGVMGNALKLKNGGEANDLVPGIALTGKYTEDLDEPSFSVSKQWKYLEGYFKYNPHNGDEAAISAIMYANGIEIGIVQFTASETVSEFRYFSSEIYYPIPSLIPDSASLVVSCSDPDNPKGTNTYLIVDELKFTDQPASSRDILQSNKLVLYPMPFNNQINLKGVQSTQNATYQITNGAGQVVKKGLIVNNQILGLEEVSQGVYTLNISGRNVIYKKIILKQ